MREMYIKYDVVAGYRLASINMGKGKISALNYVSVSDRTDRMTMTVKEFEEYQEMSICNESINNNEEETSMRIYNENVKDFVKAEMSKLGLELVGMRITNKVVMEMEYESMTDIYSVKFTKEDIDKIEEDLLVDERKAQLTIVDVLADADFEYMTDDWETEDCNYASEYREMIPKNPVAEQVLDVLYSYLPDGIAIEDDTEYEIYKVGDVKLASMAVFMHVIITNDELSEIERRLYYSNRSANEYARRLIEYKVMNHHNYAKHMVNMGY